MDSAERLAWLAERQDGIGGTDIAAICGVGFRTAAEVYAEKVAPEVVDRPGGVIMRMGLATEELNASLYRERTGASLIATGLERAASEPWAFATFDRIRMKSNPQGGGDYDCPVELKYCGPFFGDEWGPDGSDQVKDGYTIQATWEALVLRLSGADVRRTDLSALSGSGEHRVYPIPFDERLGAMLLEIGRAFWRRVEGRLGTDGWEPPLAAVARRLAEIRPDTTVYLGEDAAALVAEIDVLSGVKQAGDAAERRIKAIKEQLSQILGAAQEGALPDGRRVKQSLVNVAGHYREASSYVKVQILKPAKGAR